MQIVARFLSRLKPARVALVATGVALMFGRAVGRDGVVSRERQSYNIPLAALSVSFDEETRHFDKVKITYGKDPNYASITRNDDMYMKFTKTGREKYIYPEPPEIAHQISKFEGEHLQKVCKTFSVALEQFEQHLQKKRWGKCLYLDAFFPRFLKGFYFLYCASRNSPKALPRAARISDTLWESSLNSPKSDARVQAWLDRDDYTIRLRIATKELVFRLEEWQKKELRNKNRNLDVNYGTKFEEAFALFMKMYFVLPGSFRD